MPPAGFFARLGLFVRPDFMSPGLCAQLMVEARVAPSTAGGIFGDGSGRSVDQRVRRAAIARLPAGSSAVMEERLHEVQRDLERHFGVSLDTLWTPQLLVYRAGDFYRAHRDRPATVTGSTLDRRRVSVVIFLNAPAVEGGVAETDTPTAWDGYQGGALTFFGLLKDPRTQERGLPLVAESGLLVAFGSDVMHEVTPVTRGERYTVVTWFLGSE